MTSTHRSSHSHQVWGRLLKEETWKSHPFPKAPTKTSWRGQGYRPLERQRRALRCCKLGLGSEKTICLHAEIFERKSPLWCKENLLESCPKRCEWNLQESVCHRASHTPQAGKGPIGKNGYLWRPHHGATRKGTETRKKSLLALFIILVLVDKGEMS